MSGDIPDQMRLSDEVIAAYFGVPDEDVAGLRKAVAEAYAAEWRAGIEDAALIADACAAAPDDLANRALPQVQAHGRTQRMVADALGRCAALIRALAPRLKIDH